MAVERLDPRSPGSGRGSFSKNWAFTAHSDSDSPHVDLDWPWPDQQYGVYQHEICPTTGRYHIQGYVQFTRRVRLPVLKRLHPTAHWESARGSPAHNRAYCTKASTRAPGTEPVEFGEVEGASVSGKACVYTDAFNHARATPSIKEEDFAALFPSVWLRLPNALGRIKSLGRGTQRRDITVFLHFGVPGAGKSTYVYGQHGGAYWKAPGKWWDGYVGQECVVLDDFDGSWFTCSEFLRIFNPFPTTVEVKGSVVAMVATVFVIVSNFLPERWYSNHFKENPAHKAAVERRIDYVHNWYARGEYFVSTGVDFFAPVPSVPFTGYNAEEAMFTVQSAVDAPVVQYPQ